MECTTKELLEELSKRMPKEDILKYLKKRKEVKKVFDGIFKSILKTPWERPVLCFKYPERKVFNSRKFLEWTDVMTNFFSVAKYYEEQERGGACSVDRAYSDWLKPECKKMYDYILGY